jgi:hypothetical protein
LALVRRLLVLAAMWVWASVPVVAAVLAAVCLWALARVLRVLAAMWAWVRAAAAAAEAACACLAVLAAQAVAGLSCCRVAAVRAARVALYGSAHLMAAPLAAAVLYRLPVAHALVRAALAMSAWCRVHRLAVRLAASALALVREAVVQAAVYRSRAVTWHLQTAQEAAWWSRAAAAVLEAIWVCAAVLVHRVPVVLWAWSQVLAQVLVVLEASWVCAAVLAVVVCRYAVVKVQARLEARCQWWAVVAAAARAATCLWARPTAVHPAPCPSRAVRPRPAAAALCRLALVHRLLVLAAMWAWASVPVVAAVLAAVCLWALARVLRVLAAMWAW